MAKKSQKRLLRHERGQAGCISGLISIFHFRQGRSTKRLLSDRSRVNKQVVGGDYSGNQTVILDPTEKCESIEVAEESNMTMLDAAKTSVKELMEEEMYNEQGSGNPKSSATGLEHSNSNNGNHLKKRQKKRSRSRIKSSDLDVTELGTTDQLRPENCNQEQEQRPLDNLDLEMIMEELAQFNQRNENGSKNELHGDLDIPSGQTVNVVEEKLVAAVILLAEQRLNCSKHFEEDGNNCCSKEFVDALKTLSLNKGLLLKLLKDPNSKLVKHVQNLEDARLGRDTITNSLPASSLSEDKPGKLKCDESSSRKQRNFFRRRTKSLESYPVAEDNDLQNHNKIVILKPGQAGALSPQIDARVSSLRLQSPNMDDYKVQNVRSTSQFSFTEIKRKLRHAIGKERQGVSPDRFNLKYSPKHQNCNNGDKGNTGENICWSSPNRNHFYTERFLTSSPSFKKGEPVGKLKDGGSVAVNETNQYSRLGGSNIYVEAKKHLSEMLNNGGETLESVTRQLPKSLGRILSLPEYNNGTPCCSPRKYGDDIFVTTQIKLSPRAIIRNDLSGLSQENPNNHPSPRKQHLQSQPDISSSNCEDKIQSLVASDKITLRDDQEHFIEIQSVAEDTFDPEAQSSPGIVADIEETAESKHQEEERIITNFIESSNDLIGGDNDKENAGEVDNTQVPSQLSVESSPCFKSPFSGEDQLLSSPESPPRGPVSTEIEGSDCAMDKFERPSPISVLEPLFTDDDISPASSTSQPVEKEIQPRHIHFEEQSSASDQGICTRISLEDEESAFEYVEAVLLGSGLNWDEFLLRWISMYEILDSSLFDEVELFSSRPQHDQKLLFDCANEALKEVCEKYFGCFSGISMNIQPAPRGMDLIQEIWQRVDWHLLQLPQPHSLDQLIKADLAGSRKWMDLQLDVEFIVSEMGETIFTELVEETVLNFSDDTLECEFAVLQTESDAVEATDM